MHLPLSVCFIFEELVEFCDKIIVAYYLYVSKLNGKERI